MVRRVRILIMWWIAGLAVTVFVSWLLAAYPPRAGWSEQSYSDDRPLEHSLFVDEYRALGSMRRTWVPWPKYAFVNIHQVFGGAVPDSGMKAPRRPTPDGPTGWPDWGRVEQVRRSVDDRTDQGCEHAVGWPALALWYELAIIESPQERLIEVRGGVAWPPGAGPYTMADEVSEIRAIPWQPIWWGLFVDSLFWGMVCFGIFLGVTSTRRLFRLRRNRCPTCGYSLAGQTIPGCPECGWARAAAR